MGAYDQEWAEAQAAKDAVTEAAFKLYARWQAAWMNEGENHGGTGEGVQQWTSAGDVYGDLVQFSGDTTVQVNDDHWLFTLRPSIGDEAGMWTLYVVAGKYGGYGSMGTLGEWQARMAKEPYIVQAMWQVFDTSPSAIYEVQDQADEKLGRTVPVDVWFNLPTGVTAPR